MRGTFGVAARTVFNQQRFQFLSLREFVTMRMGRGKLWTTLVGVTVTWGSIASAARAEHSVVAELYGRGVHSYHAGQFRDAFDHLNEAIASGTQDPRALYYRGLTLLALGRGDEAEGDFATGAQLETKRADRFYDVSRSLARIQGSSRMKLEKHRSQARVVAYRVEEDRRRRRYERMRRLEPSLLRQGDAVIPAEPSDTAGPVDAPPSESPAMEPPPTEPAAPTEEPAADIPAEEPAPEEADPFAEDAAEEPPAEAPEPTIEAPAPDAAPTEVDPFAEEPPAEDAADPSAAPTDEAPLEAPPSDPPAEEPLAEEAPMDETPVEEPVEDGAAEPAPDDDPFAEEPTAEEPAPEPEAEPAAPGN